MRRILIVAAICAVIVLAYFMLFYHGGGLPESNATFVGLCGCISTKIL